MANSKLILASASPRRLELLKQIQITPDLVLPADINEDRLDKETPSQLALRLAEDKAQHVFDTSKADKPNHFILAADTVVAMRQHDFAKPQNQQEAKAFLEKFSGRRHDVLGGICVISPEGKTASVVIKTSVKFKRLTQHEIENYINSQEWAGKAGGYAIQGIAGVFIKSINGSYTNIVGLSLYETRNMLNGLGYTS